MSDKEKALRNELLSIEEAHIATLDARIAMYREALEFVLGATRAAAQIGGNRWERACRLSEATAAEALGMPALLENAEHHRAPDFTEDERRQNEAWAAPAPHAHGV
jgi:hypothetical protein